MSGIYVNSVAINDEDYQHYLSMANRGYNIFFVDCYMDNANIGVPNTRLKFNGCTFACCVVRAIENIDTFYGCIFYSSPMYHFFVGGSYYSPITKTNLY